MHSSENTEENSPEILWAGKNAKNQFQVKGDKGLAFSGEAPRRKFPLLVLRRGSGGTKKV